MKYNIIYSNKFKKQYKKIGKTNKKLQEEILYVVSILQSGDDLPRKYLNHKLQGKLSEFYECHILSDWLLIYFKDKECCIITLISTGTHANLF